MLRGKFRDYQAQTTGGLGTDATRSADEFFRLRDEERANRPPPREPMPIYAPVKVDRRKRVERREGFGQMFSGKK